MSLPNHNNVDKFGVTPYPKYHWIKKILMQAETTPNQ